MDKNRKNDNYKIYLFIYLFIYRVEWTLVL